VSPTDLVTAAVILAAAGALLVRSFRRSKGGSACHGCGDCAAGRERSRPQPLVTLGGPRPRA
jgi:hypothetical protein